MHGGVTTQGGSVFVLGTRPEAIKLVPVVHALRNRGIGATIVTTGQHRDLAREALAVFGLAPDIDLDLMRDGQTPAEVVAAALPRLGAVMAQARPALVVVQGDTASTLAGALAGGYARVPVVHVEAGLRSNAAEPFPEDLHRRLVAQIATHHFAPTELAATALRREGIDDAAITVTGNTAIDALRLAEATIAADAVLRDRLERRLPAHGRDRPLVVVTAHRRENHARMPAIADAVATLARVREIDVVVPLHPHPAAGGVLRTALAREARVTLVAPLDYLSFVMLLRRARLVLTDSGGIQEEGPALGCPVLVLRDTTERVEAVGSGAAHLVGTTADAIVAAACRLLDDPAAYRRMTTATAPYGDGFAAERIAAVLAPRLAAARPALPPGVAAAA